MEKKRFLVATDGSFGAEQALDEAIDLAQRADARLTVVYARHAPLSILGNPYYQRAISRELSAARTVLKGAARKVAAAGVEFETEILEGKPADRIVELARSRGADLIIVGSRGRGAVAGALLGSVSESIVQWAGCPVLVVKQRSRARRAA